MLKELRNGHFGEAEFWSGKSKTSILRYDNGTIDSALLDVGTIDSALFIIDLLS